MGKGISRNVSHIPFQAIKDNKNDERMPNFMNDKTDKLIQKKIW
jgi:hypothetical protein